MPHCPTRGAVRRSKSLTLLHHRGFPWTPCESTRGARTGFFDHDHGGTPTGGNPWQEPGPLAPSGHREPDPRGGLVPHSRARQGSIPRSRGGLVQLARAAPQRAHRRALRHAGIRPRIFYRVIQSPVYLAERYTGD